MYREIVAALTLGAMLMAVPVAADPPSWASGGKGKHGKEHGQQASDSDDRHEHHKEHGRHFSDHDRIVVREYYQAEFRGGKCPPGLAKKNNGCLPARSGQEMAGRTTTSHYCGLLRVASSGHCSATATKGWLSLRARRERYPSDRRGDQHGSGRNSRPWANVTGSCGPVRSLALRGMCAPPFFACR